MYEGIYGMLHRNCGRGDHKGEPKPTGPGRPLAAQLQRQGIASAEEVFWGISDGDEVELHMIL